MLRHVLFLALPVLLVGLGELHHVCAQVASDQSKEPEAAPDYISFPPVGLKIAKPEGFIEEDSFHGFGQPETQSSVVAIKIPGPFSEVSAGFTPERMKARGWTLKSKEKIEIDGLAGVLIHFMQPAGGMNFLKWAVVFGDKDKTFLVTATFPEPHQAKLSKRLKTTVLSARLDDGEEPPAGADLAFAVTASPKLRPATQIGKNLLYTKVGKPTDKSPGDPLFVAGQSYSDVAIPDKRKYAERRVRATAHTKIKEIESTEPITIDGLSGFEILATAVDEKSGSPLQVYQVMLFEDGAYILMQGMVGAEQSGVYLPEFKAMARSFKRKQP